MRTFSPGALRQARLEAGISQERLAQRIGSTKTTIQSAELGRSQPRASLIVAIADHLGIDLNHFFTHPADSIGGDGLAVVTRTGEPSHDGDE